MKDFINATLKASKELYLICKNFDSKFCDEHFIGAGGDITKEIDKIAEEIYITYLTKFGKILSEECGSYGEGKAIITIDPLDGSDNFLSQFPYYGSSIAYELDDDIKVGIVCNFANGDVFVKTKDSFKYASLDNFDFKEIEDISCSNIGIFERAYLSKEYALKLCQAEIKYRIPGAVALSLAYARRMRFVIFEGKMRPFDIKAGMFMCEDLYLYQGGNLTLICKDLKEFEYLKRVLLEE
jgi:myo-inositol-1(or 4)-monophosphatase